MIDCQLLAPFPHTIRFRTRGLEGNRRVGHFQGAFTERGLQEDHQKALRGAIHLWKEQMVLPGIAGMCRVYCELLIALLTPRFSSSSRLTVSVV